MNAPTVSESSGGRPRALSIKLIDTARSPSESMSVPSRSNSNSLAEILLVISQWSMTKISFLFFQSRYHREIFQRRHVAAHFAAGGDFAQQAPHDFAAARL